MDHDHKRLPLGGAIEQGPEESEGMKEGRCLKEEYSWQREYGVPSS